ncbi:M24 family metallopeptidase [Afifella pfennigii]|uniref:M24 family metallopeptidase n=1 Tax=Afifella pfennigii TaxID=209897 RepID=UPI00047D06AF|nr:Xaa-Pro peptidase family protein [Afifella pfennigii]
MTMAREDVFAAEEFSERREKVRAKMQARGVDAIVLHDAANIYYLCGHHTLNIWDYQCLIVPLEGPPFMVLWQFEQGRFNASATDCDPVYFGNGAEPVEATVRALKDRRLAGGRIGLEAGGGFLSPARHAALSAAMGSAEIADITGLVEDVRAVKSQAEIAVMRQAQAVTDAAMQAAIAAIGAGVTDRTITDAMASALIAGGTQGFSIFPMVAVGERSGVPHHAQIGKVIAQGDTVFLECSPAIHWYHAPLMRTAVLGTPRDPFVEEVASAGTDALNAMMEAMKPGATAAEVAMAGSNIVDRIRDRILFHDFYGYSVGIGFPPTWIVGGDMQITRSNHRPLEAGMTFHFPMTLRKLGVFGVGQSRTVVVTETGCEALSALPLGLDRV